MTPTAHPQFSELLYRQARCTPWWLLSLGFHGLLVLVLFQAGFGTAGDAGDPTLRSAVVEPLPATLLAPEPPEPLPVPPPDERSAEPDPEAPREAPPEEPVDEPDDDPGSETVGRAPAESAADLGGFDVNPTIGILGSAGGPPGGPFAGRYGRTRGTGDGRSVGLATDAGLEWLRLHQDAEGMWDCDGFMKHDRVPPVCDGAGNALYDPGVSGLALLAFLGAGETHKHGRYRKTVREGLRYLRQVQDPEGCFGPRVTDHFTYNHAIGALAMAEAFALTGSPLFRESAQRAVDFIHRLQNPYLAWRYGVRPGDNDTSVTGWMVMALKSARVAGLRVDAAAFDGARTWIGKATEPEYGRVGYTARGTGPARPQDLMDRFPADRSESLTAVGILTRIFCGEDPERSEPIRRGVELCRRALPRWDPEAGVVDMYYWYYGTLALFQVGGRPWQEWNDAMRDAILGSRRTDPPSFRGSWDPVGPWGREGGRVYATALMVMCLEVYYRYPRVFGTR